MRAERALTLRSPPADSRHGDFGCRSSARAQSDQKPIGDALCHARPSTYLPHVVSLRATLSAQGADVGEDDVVVFSDETDERWWAGLPDGWKRVDHDALGTEVKRDAWWPTLIGARAATRCASVIRVCVWLTDRGFPRTSCRHGRPFARQGLQSVLAPNSSVLARADLASPSPVGTPDSTYSLFAARRVTDWNQGVAVEVA